MKQAVPTVEEAYVRYRPGIVALCTRMMRNAEDGEDIAQDVFVKLQRKIHLFAGDCAFQTWLYRIAVNTVLERMRGDKSRRRALTDSLEQMAEDGVETGEGKLSRALLVEDAHLNTACERIVLDRVIENMPHKFRLIFDLFDVQGFNHEEVAEMLGSSAGVTKSQLFRARQWLADSLGVERLQTDEARVDDLLENFDQWLEEV